MKVSALALLGATTSVLACLTELEKRGGHPGIGSPKGANIIARQFPTEDPGDLNDGKITLGQGDRFANGTIPPRGAGSQDNATYTTYLSYAEVESGMRALAREFKEVEVFDTPYKTYENRTVRGLKIAGKKSNPRKNKGYSVLLQGGIHPRERGSSDHLLYFASDILWAARENKPLIYGGVVYSAKDVRAALDLGIVVLPAVNPDGAVFDQQTNSCWRLNRNPVDAIPGNFFSTGVDLNRNFDIAWNTTEYLAAEIQWPGGNLPGSPVYPGRGPFSEPETQNVRWTLDNFPDVAWYSDTHSGMGLIGFGRCTDAVQTTDKNMNWRNPAYNSVRGITPDRPSEDIRYREYMDPADFRTVTLASTRMSESMRDANENRYDFFSAGQIAQAAGAVGGCSLDHAYTRHILDKKKKKIFAFAFEFSPVWTWISEVAYGGRVDTPCEFYPRVDQYGWDMRNVGAGYATLLMYAAGLY